MSEENNTSENVDIVDEKPTTDTKVKTHATTIQKAIPLKVRTKEAFNEGENIKTKYSLEGNHRASFHISDINVRAVYDDGSVAETPEERVRMGRPPKKFDISGIASSTSVDYYGTEMSYEALMRMR